MQHRLEFHTITLHLSFMKSVACRPIFRMVGQSGSGDITDLDMRGREALADTVRHFLGLHKLSSYAIQTWTTMHEALASALLLELLKEPRRVPELRQLQKEFLDVVMSTLDDGAGGDSGLSGAHTKALAALRQMAEGQLLPSRHLTVGNQNNNTRWNNRGENGYIPELDGNQSYTNAAALDQSLLESLDSILWDNGVASDGQFWMDMNDQFPSI
ncbi:hypothetical protein GQ43DRAFT_480843 [Delitschia confertaspora ATCC 74209]|uniref:Uncharacterized protein n=1 Tax=Delitschia confertaspora ATCC 74209 TaxID=1513339 RepID=A0A9P4MVN0_9PLEO|nr:hypothetical protein GQ43DRAFT_480843 [Delitschia confertaspora ATCC 74209]